MQELAQVLELINDQKYQQAAERLGQRAVGRMDEPTFYMLCSCLDAIPQEAAKKLPIICLLMIAANLRKGDYGAMRVWYNQLTSHRDSAREGSRERSRLAQLLCGAGLMMPRTDNGQMLLLLSVLHNEEVTGKLPTAEFSVTDRRPSVLRGIKDFSEWGKNYRAVASIISPLLGSVTGGHPEGVASAGIAELLYEKNEINEASIEVAGTISAPDPEIAFVGYAVMARLAQLDSTSRRPDDILADAGRMIEEKGASELLPNYRAMLARADMLMGRTDRVQQWLGENEVDNFSHICVASLYQAITQASAMITLGRSREALTLLQSILLRLKEDYRPLDSIDCMALCAVACEQTGSREIALRYLEDALVAAAPYRYIRVIADKGKTMFHLLAQYTKGAVEESIPDFYLRAVLEAARNYSMQAPSLYDPQKTPGDSSAAETPELTSAELRILQLIEQGRTNQAIGDELGIKLPTVKFHVTNIYEKLGASNRVGAINAAKKLGML